MKLIKHTFLFCIFLAAFACSSDNIIDQQEDKNQDELELRNAKKLSKGGSPCKILTVRDFRGAGSPNSMQNIANYLNQLVNINQDGQLELHPCLDELLGPLSPDRNCDELEVLGSTGPSQSGPAANTLFEFGWKPQAGTSYDGSFVEAFATDGLTGDELLFYLSQAFSNSEGIFGAFGVNTHADAELFSGECEGGNVVISNLKFVPNGSEVMAVEIEYSCCRNFVNPG